MKDKNFEIKVSDILKKFGRTDEVKFENKVSDNIKNLSKEGVKGEISLQSLNKTSVSVTLHDVQCDISDQCDLCGEKYIRNVYCDEYTAKFAMPEEEVVKKSKEKEKKGDIDEVFPIDVKSETIDIEDMLSQAIILQEPFTRRCEKCINKTADNDYDDYEGYEDPDYYEATSNIIFRK